MDYRELPPGLLPEATVTKLEQMEAEQQEYLATSSSIGAETWSAQDRADRAKMGLLTVRQAALVVQDVPDIAQKIRDADDKMRLMQRRLDELVKLLKDCGQL